MKNIILVLFLCLPMIIFCQNDNFQIAIYTGPNVMFRTNELIKDTYKPAIGYQFGVATLIPLKPEKLYIQTSIQFSNYAEKFGGDDLRWGAQHDGMGGFDETLQSGDASILDGQVNNFFLDIPIGVRYYFNQGKWRFFTQPSVDLSYYLTRRTSIKFTLSDLETEVIESISSSGLNDFRTINLAGSLGFGVERNISEKLSIFFQPTATMHLFSTAKNSVTDSKLYAISGRMGINIKM